MWKSSLAAALNFSHHLSTSCAVRFLFLLPSTFFPGPTNRQLGYWAFLHMVCGLDWWRPCRLEQCFVRS